MTRLGVGQVVRPRTGGSKHEFALIKTNQQQLDPGVNPEEGVVWTDILRDDDSAASTGTESPDGFNSLPAGSVYIVPTTLAGWTAKGFVAMNWTVVNAGVNAEHNTDVAVLVNDNLPGGTPGLATKQFHRRGPTAGGESPLSTNDYYQIVCPFYFPALAAGAMIWVRMHNGGDMLEEVTGADNYNSEWHLKMVPPA